MFNKMASLVSEQGAVVDRIDSDMTETLSNVEEAQGELAKFYRSTMRNRGFILQLFGVLAFVMLLFWIYK